MKLHELKAFLDDALQPVVGSAQQRTAERNLLLQYFLGITPEILVLEPNREIAEENGYAQLQAAVTARTQQRTPVQYLVGEAVFLGLPFRVNTHVLIPRPETELLVEQAVQLCRQHAYQTALDLGTGSGCIAVSLKHLLPHLNVSAVDVSWEALEVAKENAQILGTPITFYHDSWFQPVPKQLFDIIVCNPPYIAVSEQDQLTPEVLLEPHQALFSPDDPVVLYQHLMTEAMNYLAPGGSLLFEIGLGQAGSLQPAAIALGYQTQVLPDYAGIPRVLILQRVSD